VNTQIEISQEALGALKHQLSNSEKLPKAVRLGIRGGGCSGFTYVVEFDHGDINQNDIEWHDVNLSVPFRVDKKSAVYLEGCRLTWRNSLMKSGFEFDNPNAKSICGCGHSFTVK
jgi:iron-sulfur cluster assembly protein